MWRRRRRRCGVVVAEKGKRVAKDAVGCQNDRNQIRRATQTDVSFPESKMFLAQVENHIVSHSVSWFGIALGLPSLRPPRWIEAPESHWGAADVVRIPSSPPTDAWLGGLVALHHV